MHQWLTEEINHGSSIGIPQIAMSGFARVATLPKVWPRPATLDSVLQFCSRMLSVPMVSVLQPSENHWEIFDRLCRETDARGNKIPDAYLAAFAITRGGTFVTMDAGFSRFAGLVTFNPLDDQLPANPR